MSKDNKNIQLIQMSTYNRPEIKEREFNGYVWNGSTPTEYYDYIIDRYNGSPTNRTIINSYVNRIYGRGLTVSDEKFLPLLDKIKEILSPKDVLAIVTDYATLGEGSFQVGEENSGNLSYMKHIAKNKVLPSIENEDEEILSYWYTKDWHKRYKYKPKEIPAFNPNQKQPYSIFNIKPYSIGCNYFRDPQYSSSLVYAELEEEISNFYINHIRNGLSFGYIINIKGGANYTETEQIKIEKKLKEKLTGSSNAGTVIVSFNGSEVEIEVTPLEINDAHNQWEYLTKEARQQILTGHGVTSPMLFGIKDGSGFGNNAKELTEASKVLQETVIVPMQQPILDAFSEVLKVYGIDVPLMFLPLNSDEETATSDNKKTSSEEIKDANDNKDDEKKKTELSEVKICCSDSEVNNIIDGIAYHLIELGTEEPKEYELIDTSNDNFNIKESDLNALQMASVPRSNNVAKSKQDTSLFLVRYKYAGNPKPQREFCKKVMSAGKYYRFEDLENASKKVVNAGHGIKGADKYDITLYKGGVNCRHFWERKIFLKKNRSNISVNEARKMILKLDPKDRNDAKWGQNDKKVAQTASASNNFWRYTGK